LFCTLRKLCWGADTGAALFIVVDTNVLLTHGTFLERMFAVLGSDDMQQQAAASGVTAFNIIVVVPYMVMVELDYIKDRKGMFARKSAWLSGRKLTEWLASR
jgi:hypothetical protein